jgi:hypothetical protein
VKFYSLYFSKFIQNPNLLPGGTARTSEVANLVVPANVIVAANDRAIDVHQQSFECAQRALRLFLE